MFVTCFDHTPDYWKAKGPLRQRTLCKAVSMIWPDTKAVNMVWPDTAYYSARDKHMLRILLRAEEREICVVSSSTLTN